ncbi:MAG: ATP-binding protein [Lachnospiraceae bacterium]
MRKHMFVKLIIEYLVFGVISFLAISVLIPRMTYKYTLDNEAAAMYRQATYIASMYGSIAVSDNDSARQSAVAQLTIIDRYLQCDVMVIRTDGLILLDTYGYKGVVNDFDPAISGNRYYFTGDFFGTFDHEALSVIAPININYTLRGYVLIHKNMNIIDQNADTIFNYNYLTMIIMLLFSSVFILTYIRDIYLPVRKLTQLTKGYASGDLTARAHFKRRDELGQLANSLDYMAGEIEKLNNYQNKFVANISHDLRSPLTSIKGYVEAMLDGTIPQEMQEKYLNIVLFETERLNKLTSNLLTLNNMNQGVMLDISDFDINDVIKRTILTFEGTCQQKKIQFNLTFVDKTAYVNADYSKIQQVIYNLIDNAIKFSSNNSFINISTYEKGEKVFISIKDFGIGIPKDSIEKIWDRFYKTDLSRGKDKKGTGLGLSIVKEIINAHKTTIDVISTEGTGTEFIFSLPKSKIEE